MASLSFIVGAIGTIVSVLLFLSPMGAFWRMLKHRSTEEFESLPYICTLLSSSLWTYYGITKAGEFLVAAVNGFGVVVEIVYLVLFLVLAPPRARAKTVKLIGILNVGFLAAAILVCQLLLHGEMKNNVKGLLGAGLNILMYGSPLAAMKTVVTTKSVEYMPFFLSFFVCFNGGIWTFYAVLKRDLFLGVANMVGFLLGAAQLILYAIYWKPNSSKSSISQDSEHDPLLHSSRTFPGNNEA